MNFKDNKEIKERLKYYKDEQIIIFNSDMDYWLIHNGKEMQDISRGKWEEQKVDCKPTSWFVKYRKSS